MGKAKYRYNPRTLNYEKAELTLKDKLLRVGSYLITGFVFAVLFISLFYTFFDSPKEMQLRRENDQLKLQYDILNNRLDQISKVLENIQNRDNNVYRAIFEAEPIPDNIRKAGFGGVNRYEHLENYDNAELLVETTKKIDQLAKQIYIQSKSLDEVYDMARKKEKMLASIPAIQPISNDDLTRTASGYGMRIHPIYKTRMMHTGMDFTAPTGTDIYATGDGVVESVVYRRNGYGKYIVINHGYGYKTLYAHLSKYKVSVGQKVKRGDVIGKVGNTGRSTGPHLHYEVIKNNKKINPVHFYSNDLSPEEYEIMIQLSSTNNQSFD